MKVSYFEDTDTLYIEFQFSGIAETKELDENTIIDVDSNGNIIAMTVEHASSVTDVGKIALSGIAAQQITPADDG